MVVKMMLCILVYRLKVIICYLKLFVSWLFRKLCILPMVYLLYNHCIFFLHLQIGVIIKIKLSIVTIIPLGQDRSKSDLVWSWLKVPPKIWHLDKINQSPHCCTCQIWIFCCICKYQIQPGNIFRGLFWGVKVKVELIIIWEDWTIQPEILCIDSIPPHHQNQGRNNNRTLITLAPRPTLPPGYSLFVIGSSPSSSPIPEDISWYKSFEIYQNIQII